MSHIDSPNRLTHKGKASETILKPTAPLCVEGDVKITQDGQVSGEGCSGVNQDGVCPAELKCRVGLTFWYHIGPCPLRGPPSWSRFQNPGKGTCCCCCWTSDSTVGP